MSFSTRKRAPIRFQDREARGLVSKFWVLSKVLGNNIKHLFRSCFVRNTNPQGLVHVRIQSLGGKTVFTILSQIQVRVRRARNGTFPNAGYVAQTKTIQRFTFGVFAHFIQRIAVYCLRNSGCPARYSGHRNQCFKFHNSHNFFWGIV